MSQSYAKISASDCEGIRSSAQWRQILVLEDDAGSNSRRRLSAIGGGLSQTVTVRLHQIQNGAPNLLGEVSYRAGTLLKRSEGGKAAIALELLDDHAMLRRGAVVVAGTTYGSNRFFLEGLIERGLDFITEVRASDLMADNRSLPDAARRYASVQGLLFRARWRSCVVISPITGKKVGFSASLLSDTTPHPDIPGQVFAAQTGGIAGLHRGTILGFSSETGLSLEKLLEAASWVRWIRLALRRKTRTAEGTSAIKNPLANSFATQSRVAVRSNIALAQRQDRQNDTSDQRTPAFLGTLGGGSRPLNIVELFAGAGGMGLGFLLARPHGGSYRLVLSAEVNPICVATLRLNHDKLKKNGGGPVVPEGIDPLDLRSSSARSRILSDVGNAGGVQILIGGPPCQGFSMANRNSWSSENPNNQLVDVFMTCVEALTPPIFIMENVQGILWTPKSGKANDSLGVADHLARRMERAGYIVFPKLLDAVWYGAPQHRSRFFLIGLHRDLGYCRDDFGAWGPFPRPTHGPGTERQYVTVAEAIQDLPALGNGDGVPIAEYLEPNARSLNRNDFLQFVRTGAASGTVIDHITSRHAEYVIDRYRRIPEGGNWEDIVDTMSNYADVARTHSNIYRRLTWSQPSITIGHYRKSMLVHPSQHRGLSLREASRLQSFPDWFQFAGRADGAPGGLMHKQQQLANAVCPLVTRALAEFLLAI